MSRPLARALAVAIAGLVLFAACGQSRPSATAPPSTARSVDTPSVSTRMVCAREAQHDLAETLGVRTIKAPSPTWIDHSYSCRYTYANGSFTLSVKQLPDTADTRKYFTALGSRLTRRSNLTGLGQGAYTTANGSVVVQKDDKVLLVDVHGLPTEFGVPPDTRANVAISIAATIMGCWTGA